MEYNTTLLNYIVRYEDHVAQCNEIIIQYYGLTLSPILAKNKQLIPKSATVLLNGKKLAYNFHGIGCFCILNNVKIDFDYCFGTFQYRGFETWKLWEFISSNSAIQTQLGDKQRFLNAIIGLVQNDIILPKDPSSIDTYDYFLNKELLD